MVADLKLAITGGTGFVGGRLIDLALAAGHEVRALTRREQEPRDGVTWIPGSLGDRASLERLADGADALIHVAGVINAPDPAGFEAGNVTGTSAVMSAAEKVSIKRFVHVSSLSAREPKLSAYGASKAGSEALVAASGLSYAIVRPPAVYGPGDHETFELFRMAKYGIVVLPPEGRLSLIHVDDLARLLLALSDPTAPNGILVEPDDGRHGGWTHAEFGRAVGKALGRIVVTVPLPRTILDALAKVDSWTRRDKAKLTADRVAYFCHPDWMVDPGRGATEELWKPEIATERGLADTARWYREAGWL